MDPQVKSILTTILGYAATAATAWAATHGYIHSADQVPVADAIVTAAGAATMAAIGWWKARQGSPAGLVNSMANTDSKKVAAAVDAAPLASQAAMITVASMSKVIPTTDGGKK